MILFTIILRLFISNQNKVTGLVIQFVNQQIIYFNGQDWTNKRLDQRLKHNIEKKTTNRIMHNGSPKNSFFWTSNLVNVKCRILHYLSMHLRRTITAVHVTDPERWKNSDKSMKKRRQIQKRKLTMKLNQQIAPDWTTRAKGRFYLHSHFRWQCHVAKLSRMKFQIRAGGKITKLK